MSAAPALLAAVSRGRVLVVDDNPADTALVARILNRAGLADVRELQDPHLVADALAEFDPDLVVLDLRMPVLDGFWVLALIRNRSAGAHLPVVVVTADDSRESLQRALAGGASDLVHKPFDATELVLRVRNLLLHRFAAQDLVRRHALLRARLDVLEPARTGTGPDQRCLHDLIRRTIDEGSFGIALQPVVDLRDGSVVGLEARARFPSDVVDGAAAWFAAALDVGVVAELELATIRKALALLPGCPPATVLAVRASPATALRGLVDLVPGVAWDRVVVELTEHPPVEDHAALNAALEPLRAAGARIAVEDTGSGFSSLCHLLDLHPDIITIDLAITRGIDTDPARAALAGLVAGFASDLGIQVVAQGVETRAERDRLVEVGVGFGQGDLLGAPLLVG